jgi:hypothetical protein
MQNDRIHKSTLAGDAWLRHCPKRLPSSLQPVLLSVERLGSGHCGVRALDLLKRQKFENSEWMTSSDKHEFLLARSPHTLIQAAGYLKYIYARDQSQGVYFRGQGELYGTLSPSLYRGIKLQGARDKREADLKLVPDRVRKSAGIFSGFGEYAHEPLLQHYGISTTWVDLVDNVWIALWFACNRAIISGTLKDHMHFEERTRSSSDQFVYVLFVAADIGRRNRTKPGFFFGPNTELVDLRMAVPSVFLRPHSQHALLFRRAASGLTGRATDYRGQICGVIGVELSMALEWLGHGKMVNAHSLFPPPCYDHGFEILLRLPLAGSGLVGNILHVAA